MLTRSISSSAQLAVTIKEWWTAKSETASVLTGESYSHGEVVLSHLGLLAMVLAMGVVGTLFG